MDKAMMASPSTLAFVGDAVFGLLVRTKLAEVERPIGQLHKMSVDYVNANAQAEGFEMIKDLLTEKEMSVFKRARNHKTLSSAKNASIVDYRRATGFEAVIGYLYLIGNMSRLNEILNLSIGEKDED